jgi:hypothetical protein
MEFKVLGPLEVRRDGSTVPLPRGKPLALLAMLLLHANEPVPAERLALALWGDEAPAGAVRTVQVYVSRLRRALDDETLLATTPAGAVLREALRLWRGPALAELAFAPFAQAEADRAPHGGALLRSRTRTPGRAGVGRGVCRRRERRSEQAIQTALRSVGLRAVA